MKPENRVNRYAKPTVIKSNLPAFVPKFAIPGTTKPIINNGITNPKKLPKILFMVTNTLVSTSGKNIPQTIPSTMAIKILGNNPNFFMSYTLFGYIYKNRYLF